MATRMFIKGRYITAATIQGGVRSATGTIVYSGTAYSLTGKLAGIVFANTTVRATINSIDDRYVNEEILMDGGTCQIQEIMTTKQDSGTVIAVEQIFMGFDYAQVILTVGTAPNAQVYTWRGVRGDLSTGVSSAGENVATLSLQNINDGNATNFTIA